MKKLQFPTNSFTVETVIAASVLFLYWCLGIHRELLPMLWLTICYGVTFGVWIVKRLRTRG